jgi:IS1 family transposase
MRHYRKKYFELQLDTHSAVRALRTYAEAQEKHLSDVVPDNEAQNSDNGTSLTKFIAINASIVKVQKKKADDLHRRYTFLKDEWKSVVKIVTEGIEDFKKKIKEELARKREEKRKETRTLEQICISLGITVFSGVAFLTGGILFPLAGVIAGGLYFVCLTGDILIKIWDDAKKVKAILQNLDQICTKVKTSVSLMSSNWSDILNCLCSFDDFHIRIESPGGSEMLKKAIKNSIDSWVEVRKAADNYLEL